MHYIAYVHRTRFFRDALTEPPSGPVVIHDGRKVVEVCEAARHMGVRPGIKFIEARTLAKGATFILTEPISQWEAARVAWTQPLRRFTDRIELPAPNQAYLDLTAHPDPYSLLADIQQAIPPSYRFGIGRSKWLARTAALRGDVDADWVARPDRKLQSLPVRVLPFPPDLISRLSFLGCATVGDVQALHLDTLRNQFGELGRSIHQATRGLLTDTLTPNDGPPRIRASRHVPEGVIERAGLEHLLRGIATELAAGLTNHDRHTRDLYAWWNSESASHRTPKPIRTATQIAVVLSKIVSPTEPLTDITVEVAMEQSDHHRQYTIADPRDPDAVAETVHRLKTVFGDASIQCASEVAVPRRVRVLKAWMMGGPG